MERFNDALRRRSYSEALSLLKDGLRATPAAATEMQHEWGIVLPPSVPFIEPQAGAIAALFDDREALQMIRDTAAALNRSDETDCDQYERDAELAKLIRVQISAGAPITVPELKTHVSVQDRGRVSRLLTYMEKNSELWIGKIGSVSVIHAGAAEQVPQVRIKAFRAGCDPVPVHTIELFECETMVESTSTPHNAGGAKDASGERGIERSRSVLPSTPLHKALRLPGVMTTLSLATCTWLAASPKRHPDGSFSTEVVVKELSGAERARISLTHAAHRAFVTSQRDHIITVDKKCVVRILDEAGTQLAAIALARCPDVLRVQALDGVQARDGEERIAFPLLRCADADLGRHLLLFSVLDHLFVFDFDGTELMAVRTPLVQWRISGSLGGQKTPADLGAALTELGASPRLSLRQVVSLADARGLVQPEEPEYTLTIDLGDFLPHSPRPARTPSQVVADAVGGVQRDWVYFARFSSCEDSVYLSTYSGLLLRLSATGDVLNAWVLDGQVAYLADVPGGLEFALTGRSAFRFDGESPPRSVAFGVHDCVRLPTSIAHRSGREISLLSLRDWTVQDHLVERDVRAIYPAGGMLRIDQTTTQSDLS